MRPPRPGDVIHYRYLWRHEAARKLEQGKKARACLVLATQPTASGLLVFTCPISTKNHDPNHSVPIPPAIQAMLGLTQPSLIVWNDLNRFVWVGPDIELKADDQTYYGNVGRALWDNVRQKVLAAAIPPTIRTG